MITDISENLIKEKRESIQTASKTTENTKNND